MSLSSSLYPKVKFPHFHCKPVTETCRLSLFTRNNSFKCLSPLFPPANQSVAAIVFGDGSSSHSKLYPLTKRRSESAIPIAGNYRLIDAVVSNCINSDIIKIYALTQYNSTSLNSHLSRAYSSGARLSKDGFVEVIAAYQSPEEENGWFQGTADAIRRCLGVLEEYPVLEFLLLPGHHLYKMDYQKLIDAHRRTKADITVPVFSRKKDEDLGFGVFKLNAGNQVLEFTENLHMTTPNSVTINYGDDEICNFPSMGIYVINRNIMIKLLKEYFPSANDLKGEVIPGAISHGMKMHGYQFDGYWETMRSIKAYYNANMEMIQRTNQSYNFYDRDYPLFTLPHQLPPTLIADAVITDSVIGDGCILSKCRINGSSIGTRTKVCDEVVIEDSIIMGSDKYYHQISEDRQGIISIPVGIGKGSLIKKAIIDKNARIGKNVMIINKDNVQEGNNEANGYMIVGGIVVIIKGVVIPDGSIL